MTTQDLTLDLFLDPGALTAALCDIESVSGNEGPIADAVEAALRGLGRLRVERDGDAVVASTDLGRAERVVLAGHLDTVPLAGNLPARVEDGVLHGCGTSDMKSGVAVQLALAAAVAEPVRDVTWIFYDHEEVEASLNGLGRLARDHPDWLLGDLAVLLEPTGGVVEGGCQGTLRVEVTTTGVRAHSARSWMGVNAIHGAAGVLAALSSYEPATVEVDGLAYREGLNAVGVRGGVAGNVVPDECVVLVNYRFAPTRTVEQAEAHVRDVLAPTGAQVRLVDAAPAALPGLSVPAARSFVEAVGGRPRAKLGWTDVARFSALGVPAVNFGPGEPTVAHTATESVELAAVTRCFESLRSWLTR